MHKFPVYLHVGILDRNATPPSSGWIQSVLVTLASNTPVIDQP